MVISKSGVTVPISEIVTADHSTINLMFFLSTIRNYVRKRKVRWPMSKVVIVDWTWPSINALLREFVDMKLLEYLEVTF